MRTLHRLILPSLTVCAIAACEDPQTPNEVDLAQFNKKGGSGVTSECGGQTDLLDSRVSLDWSESTAISGDASGPVYLGGAAGVHAKIFYHDRGCSVSGDMIFDADMNGKGNNRRSLTFHFPADKPAELPATASGAPFINFRGLQFLGSDIGQPNVADGRDARVEAKNPDAPRALEHPSPTAERPEYPNYNGNSPAPKMRFVSMGIPGCETLEYDRIVLTRTAGSFAPTGEYAGEAPLGVWSHEGELGEWIVASVETEPDGTAGHWAQCYHTVRGTLEPNGTPMDMPFSVVITEQR